MIHDAYTAQPPPMRRLGRSSVLASSPRRHSSTRASSELTLRYSDRELRRAFRSIQSPLATASGAIMFGLGLAVALLGLASLSLSAWPAIGLGLVSGSAGAAILVVPLHQARTAAERHGDGRMVAIQLVANQHGLAVFDGEETTLTPWSAIDRVQINDRHIGLVAGRSFVVPPLRLDDEQGPFAARVLEYARSNNVSMPMRSITPSW
ncbi:MAG: hypothetical protein R2733_15735 [Acidimicrobiales bacterium]